MTFVKFADELPPLGEPIQVAWASGAKRPNHYLDSVPYVLHHAVTREECPGECFIFADASGGWGDGYPMIWAADELPTHWARWPGML